MEYHVEFDINFKRNPHPGIFIALEGIDGSGKTTQAEKLKAYFENLGKTVLKTHEPGRDGSIGRIIGEILEGKIKIPQEAFQYLCSAQRVIHYQETVIPSLKKGVIIISDRSIWSSVPYGILDLKGMNYDFKETKIILVAQGILSMYHQFIIPDYTFILDVSVDKALARLSQKKKDQEIYEQKEMLEKVATGYAWLAKEFPEEITVIAGERPVEIIAEEILSYIKNKI